jgi:hypothetical protein
MDIGIDHNLHQRSTATVPGPYAKVRTPHALSHLQLLAAQRKGLSLTVVRLPACATGSRADRARDAGTPMLERVGEDGVARFLSSMAGKMPSELDDVTGLQNLVGAMRTRGFDQN